MLLPTTRLLFLALCAAPAIVLAGSRDRALGVAFVWVAAVLLLALVDAWFVRPSDELVWHRSHDTKLSLGVWNPVTLSLQNRTSRRVTIQVRDAVPRYLVPQGEAGKGICNVAESWVLQYRVFPIHRGDFTFGPVSARCLGPLGLVWWQSSTSLPGRVKVYPNLRAIGSYEALVRRGHLHEMGLRNSRRWGSGTEFERLRDYGPDDEYRRINWAATARRNKPMAVDYQTERSQNIMLVLDAGRLMSTRIPLPEELVEPEWTSTWLPPLRFDELARTRDGEVGSFLSAPQALTRLDYALNASVLLAFVSQQHGDRVGVLSFSDRVLRYVAPRPGRKQFLAIVEALYALESQQTEANYAEGLGYLTVRNPRRSLAVVFTDITGPDAASTLVAQMVHLARRHLPLVVTLRDPGVESLATMHIEGAKAVYDRAVARTLLDEREQTLSRLRQHGVLTLDVPADQISSSLVNRYLEIKGRGAL